MNKNSKRLKSDAAPGKFPNHSAAGDLKQKIGPVPSSFFIVLVARLL